MVELRSDIPIPTTDRPKRAPNNPWSTMEVGESFFVRIKSTAVAGCYQQGPKLGKRFTWEARREEGPDGKPVNGFRVWRVE